MATWAYSFHYAGQEHKIKQNTQTHLKLRIGCFVPYAPCIPLTKSGHMAKPKVSRKGKYILPSINHGKGEKKGRSVKK